MSLLHGGHDIEVEIKSLKIRERRPNLSQAEKVSASAAALYDWGQSRGAIDKLVGAFELELYRGRC
jgi:hypothetical protein